MHGVTENNRHKQLHENADGLHENAGYLHENAGYCGKGEKVR